jgi:hypothetical protein
MSWHGESPRSDAPPDSARHSGLPAAVVGSTCASSSGSLPNRLAPHAALTHAALAEAGDAPLATTSSPQLIGRGSGRALLPAAPASHRGSLERSRWAELQPELLAAVLAATGHSPDTARVVSQVCSAWRQGLGGERGTLRLLHFQKLELQSSSASRESGSSIGEGSSKEGSRGSSRGSSGGSRPALPWLLELAVKAGNVAATVAAARFLEQRGRLRSNQPPADAAASAARAAATWYGASGAEAAEAAGAGTPAWACGPGDDAARYWVRAAKAGHPEAQWRLGWGHYKVRQRAERVRRFACLLACKLICHSVRQLA